MNVNQNPLPLTIVSGYLGAGKTTLINHLLRHAEGRRLVVLVNDFGDLPIDADLIESQDGDTLNLSNGCACCSMGGDLFNALVNALERTPRPDHLLIEASGVADPVRIANIALAEPDLTLDSTVSLVDASDIVDLVQNEQIGETVTHQLASADVILMNKLDLIDVSRKTELFKLFDNIAPKAQKVETEYARIPIDIAIGSKPPGTDRKEEQLLTGDHGNSYIKWSKMCDISLDRSLFEKVLDDLDGKLLRLKGIAFFKGSDKPNIVQLVGNRWTITQMQSQAQSQSTTGRNQSRIVAIGLKGSIDPNALDIVFSDFI